MDHSLSPPSPTWLPSARPQGTPKFSTSFRPFSPSQITSSSTRSPPAFGPMSSSTHLLQDLEPRTYDSPSDAESVPSEYQDSPPTPTGPVTGRKGEGLSQVAPRDDISISTRNSTPRSKLRWQRMQQRQGYTGQKFEKEQQGLGSTPQPISRASGKAEAVLSTWARSTDTGRIGREEEDGIPVSMQPEWMRSSTFPQPSSQGKVKFEIPPPITASLLLPSTSGGDGARRRRGEQSILSSIFGAFPSSGRDQSSENDIGRNKTSRLGEEWTDIVRQERVLQGQIQELLDLQASGLQRVGGGGSATLERDSRSSTRSRSNFSESSMRSVNLQSSATLHGRYPQNNIRALHTARMELLKAMYTSNDLAVAKKAVLAETSQRLEAAYKQLLLWERKKSIADRNLLKLEMGHGASDNEAKFARQLRHVDIEISDLENRLRDAKEKREKLLRKRVEGRSVKEAEAAKWVELKREVDRDVGKWLRDPDVPNDMLDEKESYRNEHWGGFMKLNPRRRNLEVAVEGLAGAISGVKERMVSVETEIEGCERGTKIWSECLELVMKSEKALKEFLQRSVGGKENLGEEILELMNDTEKQLVDKLHVCSHEGWNLLVACLGAEVEAWREGVEVMGKMMGHNEQESQDAREKHLRLEPSTNSLPGEEDTKQRWHSGSTNSTEDPMRGSGIDNDAQILEDPSSILSPSSQGSRLFKTETIPILTPTAERRPSRQSDGTEDDNVIHTEGLKISPGHSPWLNSSPNKGSKGSGSPDRELSFRTAMEYSVQVERENGAEGGNGSENAEKETVKKRNVDEEVLTPREERVPPHLRKVVKGDGEKNEESDGEVPADLLG